MSSEILIKKENYSFIQQQRLDYELTLPQIFQNNTFHSLQIIHKEVNIDPEIKNIFPYLSKNGSFVASFSSFINNNNDLVSPIRIGCVLSGGQAAGGHNVIAGLFDFLKKIHPNSQLFGFLKGPIGIYTGKYIEITEDLIKIYRNQGGFDIICSGRHKIETSEQFSDSLKYCEALKLDGLVVIGGDDSNTNACLLAEYFLKENSNVKVIGVPKTIDGDLKNEYIEVSFGFDTATKTYSEVIGNVCLDTLSSKKYYHFIRLMGRSASHIALECGLINQPNLILIGEEVEEKNKTLIEITKEIKEMIIKRHEQGKDFGVILVPEGLIEFIPEIKRLILEINEILKSENISSHEMSTLLNNKLTKESLSVFNFLPSSISEQLLLDRDPHGNVLVSRIDTEKLLILILEEELKDLNIPFLSQSHFFGYEGRSCLPSSFDSEYCYSLGYNAGFLITKGLTGYMSIIRNLTKDPSEWKPEGCPLTIMMNVERRKGKNVPVIKKALVDLSGEMFNRYSQLKEIWKFNDFYINPGPIQFNFNKKIYFPYLVYTERLTEDKLNEYKFEVEDKESPYALKSKFQLGELSKFLIEKETIIPNCLLHKYPEIQMSNDFIDKHSEELNSAFQRDFSFLSEYKYNNSLAEVSFSTSKCPLLNLRIGIVFNGRQAPGGNNIIKGMLEFQKKFSEIFSNKIDLLGFKNGTVGLFNKEYITITEEKFKYYSNLGGFDFLGRSADKIRTDEELLKTKATCTDLNLDGLILVGASHTMSDSLILSNYFLKENIKTKIVSIPCTVDGNISHSLFEGTLGFDTASKLYSQQIGNLMIDAASNIKYWYFIRLMGKDPSHLVLECALQTHPNYVIISEEIAKNGYDINNIVSDICDIIVERSKLKQNYGIIVIPEGLPTYLQSLKILIKELNQLVKQNIIDCNKFINANKEDEYVKSYLSPSSAFVFLNLPQFFKKELLLERETSGNIQLSQLETERLLAYFVDKELLRRKANKEYDSTFSYLCHFFGYQGRCSHPTQLDASLGLSYGFTSCLLISKELTGFMTTAKGLSGDIEDWILGGIPISSMMSLKYSSTYGKSKCHIPSNDVDLNSKSFLELKKNRKKWAINNCYRNPGPVQLIESRSLRDNMKYTLNFSAYKKILDEIDEKCKNIKQCCRFGMKEKVLETIKLSLSNIEDMIKVLKDDK